MSAPDQGRAAVLARVRAPIVVSGAEGTRAAAVEDRLRRHPRGTIPARALQSPEACIELLEAMLASQGAKVTRATTPEDAVRAVAWALRAHDLPLCFRMGTDPVLGTLPWDAAPELERRFGAAEAEDRAALSRAVAAAAETGTLFLVSGADNPTTLSFLPEAHTILIRSSDIVGCYEEAFDLLRALFGAGTLPRTVNMISGPSRTADIEQTIVRGAHGPKHLHVVIVG
ncbi:MAG: lactate utilization protein [Methyloceanibacter sp.]